MHDSIHTATQVDLIRAEQSVRRRRAAVERTARAARRHGRPRRRPWLPSVTDGYRDPWPEIDLGVVSR